MFLQAVFFDFVLKLLAQRRHHALLKDIFLLALAHFIDLDLSLALLDESLNEVCLLLTLGLLLRDDLHLVYFNIAFHGLSTLLLISFTLDLL